MNNERTDEILSELNAAIEHDPDRDKNYYKRGLIYKSEGLWEKAEADFAKAFSLWTDPLYLHEWREVAKERQALQTLEERMAPYAEIINKIKDISDDPPPFDDTENISTVELIAALALFEEYEVLKTLFKSGQYTLNETVSPAFAYWQPTPLYFITAKKNARRNERPVQNDPLPFFAWRRPQHSGGRRLYHAVEPVQHRPPHRNNENAP